jgi:cytoplasmic iron level regulating protein YaaA (DUF328/UPF0246 family)
MTILLPPSEGKAAGGEPATSPGRFDEELGRSRAAVIKSLKRAVKDSDEVAAKKLFGATGFLLERAIECAKSSGEESAPTLPAWQRYEGVVWTYLNPSSLTSAQRRKILIPSGLYGLNRGDDLIEEYRLTMNVSLPGVGNVGTFWRDWVREALTRTRGPIVSLLPTEHLAVIDEKDPALHGRFNHISFVGANGLKAAGHDAKAVKGVLARSILDEGVEVLTKFQWMGWKTRQVGSHWLVVAPATRFLKS